jgi:hypothetical protein
MMTNEEFWDQALVDLLAEMPDTDFEVVQLPDQKPHAHMVDRPDIEIVPVDSDPQTGRNYDAWQRPVDTTLDPFAVDPSQVLTDMAPSPVMLSMNLGETVNWLNLQLLMTPSGQLRSTKTEPPSPPPPA